MKTTTLIFSIFTLPVIAHADCFDDAARRYGIAEPLLRAVAKVESGGNPKATNLTHIARTKTYDIGLMQVNSSWLPRLAKFGITEEKLREPCQNVMVGAWILSNHFRESGADWNGVGAYNASCRTMTKEECGRARNTYSWKVYRALLKQQGAELKGSPMIVSSTPVGRAVAGRRIRSIEVSLNESIALADFGSVNAAGGDTRSASVEDEYDADNHLQAE